MFAPQACVGQPPGEEWRHGRALVHKHTNIAIGRREQQRALEQAITKGAASEDFFGTAYGSHDGTFDGFKLGDANVQLDDTLLLIELETAKQYRATQIQPGPEPTPGPSPIPGPEPQPGPGPTPGRGPTPGPGPAPKAHTFIGTAEVNATAAKMRLVQIADEIISLLTSDPQATLQVTLEITAEFPAGVSDQIKRAVSENATSLKLKNVTWE